MCESKHESLKKGNREVITDFYVSTDITSEEQAFKYHVFVRLNAKKITFKNVSFMHCIFEHCYLNNCVFDSCDFTGCKFIASNFHQSAFSGCSFKYATFERTHLDDDILLSEAPQEENLKMHFARSLRMNYQQIGDAKAVNKAINVELEATSIYLKKSWQSKETYYTKKYPGIKNNLIQFIKWSEFSILNFIWGNGESVIKFIRFLALIILSIGIYDAVNSSNPHNLKEYWSSFLNAPSIFLGVSLPENYSNGVLTLIAGAKLISFALLTTLLIKRFSRR
ncbi:pentapeptide repeat-containing protein [Endozoicomonas sp. ALC020]|uniref:pentapeptide repeat-containing protein n=1 Tax=unclassified Endozoicomonas TaxID=2644528 RepID=UPI003BAF572C